MIFKRAITTSKEPRTSSFWQVVCLFGIVLLCCLSSLVFWVFPSHKQYPGKRVTLATLREVYGKNWKVMPASHLTGKGLERGGGHDDIY